MKYFMIGFMLSMLIGSVFSGIWVPIGSGEIIDIASQMSEISTK